NLAVATGAALFRDGFKCQSCGITGIPGKRASDLQVHHIEYRKNGGTNELENLITLCQSCHKARHAAERPSKQIIEKPPRKTKEPKEYCEPQEVPAEVMSAVMAELGRRGGKVKSAKKTAAARKNARKPRKGKK